MKEELLIACPHCQTKNRISLERYGQEATCGKCSTKFIANYTEPVAVTDTSFSQEVLTSPIPVLVDFWAPWCGPCRMVAPILEQLAQEYAGKIKIAKVNTDENQQYAIKYQVQGIPTLLFVKQGQVLEQVVGVAQKPVLQQKIQQLLSA